MINPIGYRLLIKPIEVEEKTKGGIIIPDEHKDQKQWKQSRGEVVALGELAFTKGQPKTEEFIHLTPKPKPGDIIMYREYAGYNFSVEDQKFTLLDDDDCMAIVEIAE